jgi:hypothetical protein
MTSPKPPLPPPKIAQITSSTAELRLNGAKASPDFVSFADAEAVAN